MEMSIDAVKEPPRLASKFWDEYSGKQKLLSSFFGKKPVPQVAQANGNIVKESSAGLSNEKLEESHPVLEDALLQTNVLFDPAQAILLPDTEPSPLASGSDTYPPISPQPESGPREDTPSYIPSHSDLSETTRPQLTKNSQSRLSAQPTPPPKRKKAQADSNYPASQSSKKVKLPTKDSLKSSTKTKGGNNKLKPKKSGQTSIASFFAAPSSSQATEPPSSSQPQIEPIDVDEFLSSDDAYGIIVNSVPSPSQNPSSKHNGKGKEKSSQSWSKFFAQVEPPKCIVHGESTREFTVNKSGPNKGKRFFICSR